MLQEQVITYYGKTDGMVALVIGVEADGAPGHRHNGHQPISSRQSIVGFIFLGFKLLGVFVDFFFLGV